jgi:predicted ATPase
LAQAFQGLVRPLLSKSDAELRYWRDALCEALGPNGLLIPELKHIIGEQPPVHIKRDRKFRTILRAAIRT